MGTVPFPKKKNNGYCYGIKVLPFVIFNFVSNIYDSLFIFFNQGKLQLTPLGLTKILVVYL